MSAGAAVARVDCTATVKEQVVGVRRTISGSATVVPVATHVVEDSCTVATVAGGGIV